MPDNPIEYKFSRIDEAIQRLASVAADISKMIAVHEQRISQQEKRVDNVTTSIEKRRDVIDQKFDDVYKTIERETIRTTDEIRLSRDASLKQHEDQNIKISSIQKLIWMASGVIMLASWLIPLLAAKMIK